MFCIVGVKLCMVIRIVWVLVIECVFSLVLMCW